MKSFECQTFGKWILAGEHAVLRGCPALVFPITSQSMKFSYLGSPEELKVNFSGAHGEELRLLFWGVIEQALSKVKQSRKELTGQIQLWSDLPVGAGLGASAALCVALGRWISWMGWIEETEIYEFSRSLENLFHGESSGVDIAVALSGHGLKFLRNGPREPIKPMWKPQWYLSSCGKRGVTSECVQKVKELAIRNEELAQHLDQEMSKSVQLAERALVADEKAGFALLEESIEKAASCFLRWGLTEGELDQHMRDLRRHGAVAVKPTGSGGGGYVLSLWNKPPPTALLEKFIFI